MKKYNIIYADPPWPYKNKNTGGSMKSGASNHYPTMSIEDICNMDVQSISDDDCVLFMWWVGSMPEEAIQIVKAWGFKIKNMNGFVWVKLTKRLLLFFGMGFWTRAGSESCIIATKGKIKPVKRNIRAVIKAVNEKHSKKPNIFRKKIIELCGDIPRIELFAREKLEGFDVWGNEVKSDVKL